jgi:NHLM bacteriocin system ABC transporter, ATP-binding protein
MGLYDQQIKQRIEYDDKILSESFDELGSVVMGERFAKAFNDKRILTKNAIDEVMKFYHIPLQDLIEGVTNINEQLEYLMRPSGIMRRSVVLEDGWYKDSVGAMLGTRKDNGMPVALLPSSFGYTYLDAETGKRVRLSKSTAAAIDNEAICFYKPLPVHEITINDLRKYIFQCLSVSDFVITAGAVLTATLVGLLVPAINNIIYNYVVTSTNMTLFFAVFMFLISTNIAMTLLEGVKTLIINRLKLKMNLSVEAAGMIRLLSLPASFFKKYSSGDLANRINQLSILCTQITDVFLTAGLTSIFSLIYIIQMFRYGSGMVVPGLIVILISIIISTCTTIAQARYNRKTQELASKENGLSFELVSGIQKIRLAGAENRAFAKWANLYTKQAKRAYNPPVLLSLSTVFLTTVALIGTIVIYYFTITTHVALADYFAFNASYAMIMAAFSTLAGAAKTMSQIHPELEMLEPILQEVPEISENKQVVSKISSGIEIDHLTFRYDEDSPNVFNNLSLKIKPGQYVAIVGKSGCGKSTLMRLLLGFETPQNGTIYYGGKDISTLDLKSLRRHIGSVMQDGKLFQGDIYSNIIITAPWLTMDDAWKAAELAGMADDIRKMPMGMHTLISGGSGGISGGQRQRLMIARAIAPKPDILIFDEATSALDNVTQKKVTESLDSLKCTRIVIAHRLSTIRQCDRIVVLDDGKIAEDGTFDELLAKGGLFAELVERQRLDVH